MAELTKVPFEEVSSTTTGAPASVPSHLIVQCLLPENNASKHAPTHEYNETLTDSHARQCDLVLRSPANRAIRFDPPEVDRLQGLAAGEEETPEMVVELGIRLAV